MASRPAQDRMHTIPSPTRLRIGGYAPPESVHSAALDRFADEVERRSGGELVVDVVHNVMDEGRPATDLFEAVRSGHLTWCYYSTSYLGPIVPELDVLEVPYLFPSVGAAHRVLDGPVGRRLADAVRQRAGFEVLGFWDNGLRHLTNADRPIRHPEDCRNLRIRLQPNPIHSALARAWHMVPIEAELSEGIAMIERGDVDAQENPLANTVAYGVDHRYVTLTGHLYGARGLFADPAALAALGEAGSLVRAAARVAIDHQREAAAAREVELHRVLVERGRLVVELSGDERAAFVAAAGPVIASATAAVDPTIIQLLDQPAGERNQP